MGHPKPRSQAAGVILLGLGSHPHFPGLGAEKFEISDASSMDRDEEH